MSHIHAPFQLNNEDEQINTLEISLLLLGDQVCKGFIVSALDLGIIVRRVLG